MVNQIGFSRLFIRPSNHSFWLRLVGQAFKCCYQLKVFSFHRGFLTQLNLGSSFVIPQKPYWLSHITPSSYIHQKSHLAVSIKIDDSFKKRRWLCSRSNVSSYKIDLYKQELRDEIRETASPIKNSGTRDEL